MGLFEGTTNLRSEERRRGSDGVHSSQKEAFDQVTVVLYLCERGPLSIYNVILISGRTK